MNPGILQVFCTHVWILGSFNEAGAMNPGILCLGCSPSPDRGSFNEAGAMNPGIPLYTEALDKVSGYASMRPGL